MISLSVCAGRELLIVVDDFQQHWEKSFQHTGTSLAGQAACSRSFCAEERLDRCCYSFLEGSADYIPVSEIVDDFVLIRKISGPDTGWVECRQAVSIPGCGSSSSEGQLQALGGTADPRGWL